MVPTVVDASLYGFVQTPHGLHSGSMREAVLVGDMGCVGTLYFLLAFDVNLKLL
jgi:hypothetical protein